MPKNTALEVALYQFDNDISDDTFSRKTKVHDWRNHVLSEIQEAWSTLSERERKLIALTAQKAADNEEWD